MNETVSARISDVENLDAMMSMRKAVVAGYAVVIGFVCLFLVWAATMPLSSAAIAPGVVGVDGQRRTVQHPYGGIIADIDARDGDFVRRGEVLIALDPTDDEASYRELDGEILRLEVELARWQAEQRGISDLVAPEAVLDHPDQASVAGAIEEQQRILTARSVVAARSLNTLNLQRERIDAEIDATRQRAERLSAQARLVGLEVEEYHKLEKRGLVTRADLFDLEKELRAIELDLAESVAAERLLEKQARENRALVREQRSLREQEAAEEQSRVVNRLVLLRAQRQSAQARLNRHRLRAPIDGYVMNSSVNTIGGVITAGQVVMDIMPHNERLVIDTRVEPRDRDAVQVGQRAQVRLRALDRRSSQPLEGIVRMIAADSVPDPATQLPYYRTRVELIDEGEADTPVTVLHPGMQADVIIVTGQQTLLGYLVSPLARSFNRALRED